MVRRGAGRLDVAGAEPTDAELGQFLEDERVADLNRAGQTANLIDPETPDTICYRYVDNMRICEHRYKVAINGVPWVVTPPPTVVGVGPITIFMVIEYPTRDIWPPLPDGPPSD